MSAPTASSYDQMAYPAYAFPQTHPDLLGTLAALFGLPAPPADACRVLELGCASGGNLIPLAVALPKSEFVGVDYSATQVKVGLERIERLGLRNADIRHASILDVDASWGRFDYVICHGVYSWVPEEVQDGILRVCAENLAPEGVGYISYNTLPGWHMRGAIREMMCYHDTWHSKKPPAFRVDQARALLEFLADATKSAKTPYSQLLQSELGMVQESPDGYLFHDHLEEHNAPIYFFEFDERLAARGLRFLGEASFFSMVHSNVSPEVRQLVALAPNLIQMEQYLDFLSNRMFRQSLVVHERRRPNYSISTERVYGLQIASPLRVVEVPANVPADGVTFGTEQPGQTVTTNESVLIAALGCLAEVWPATLPFDELSRRTQRTLGRAEADETQRQALAGMLLKLYSAGGARLVEFWRNPPAFARQAGERPTASPLVRLMVQDGNQTTSLRHGMVTVSDFDRHLLGMLDGSRSRANLLARLLEAQQRGQLNIVQDGSPPRDEHQARAILRDALDKQLRAYAERALLSPA